MTEGSRNRPAGQRARASRTPLKASSRGRKSSEQAPIRKRYVPLEVIGSGGQGRVMRAFDKQLNRIVALKERQIGSEEDRDALLDEARILHNLKPHSGVSIVREDFFVRDRYYLVMDWVEGTSLQALLNEQGTPGLPLDTVVEYLGQAAEAIDHLHGHHPAIIHKDVKPANLILTPDGRIVLVDFGIARSADAQPRAEGTPGYAAPEISQGVHPSPATDMYGLGATAYALLTGSPPPGNPDWSELPARVRHVIETVIRPVLATDPAKRPGAATMFVQRLATDRWWIDVPATKAQLALLGGGALLVVVGTLLPWQTLFGLTGRGLAMVQGVAALVAGLLALLCGYQLWTSTLLRPRWNRKVALGALLLMLLAIGAAIYVPFSFPTASEAPPSSFDATVCESPPTLEDAMACAFGGIVTGIAKGVRGASLDAKPSTGFGLWVTAAGAVLALAGAGLFLYQTTGAANERRGRAVGVA